MKGEKLHALDVRICRILRANLQTVATLPELREFWQETLPESLYTFIASEDAPAALVLNDDELDFIDSALEDFRCDQLWNFYPKQFEIYTESVAEVRSSIALPVADAWAEACQQHRSELAQPELRLSEGLLIVCDWLQELRKLLRDLGAFKYLPCPEGEAQTPTCSETFDQTVIDSLNDEDKELLAEIEALIVQKNLRKSKSSTIVLLVGKRRNRVLKLLRRLKSEGKYDGVR